VRGTCLLIWIWTIRSSFTAKPGDKKPEQKKTAAAPAAGKKEAAPAAAKPAAAAPKKAAAPAAKKPASAAAKKPAAAGAAKKPTAVKKTVATKAKGKDAKKKILAGKKPQSVLAKLSAKARAAAKAKKGVKPGTKPAKGTAKAKAVALLNAKKVQKKVWSLVTDSLESLINPSFPNPSDHQGRLRHPRPQDPHQRALPSAHHPEAAQESQVPQEVGAHQEPHGRLQHH